MSGDKERMGVVGYHPGSDTGNRVDSGYYSPRDKSEGGGAEK